MGFPQQCQVYQTSGRYRDIRRELSLALYLYNSLDICRRYKAATTVYRMLLQATPVSPLNYSDHPDEDVVPFHLGPRTGGHTAVFSD